MAAAALPRGYNLHEYRIDSTLGVGGFGLTYLATDANLNVKVAIKEYLPAESALRCEDQSVRPNSEEAAESFNWGLERFIDESRTLASFRHPNIVRVMRFFQANQTAYMVMEFVAGEPLSQWIRPRRPVPEPALRAFLMPLLDGLDVVHTGGYLHRDIKPANIFMRADNSPVLLDFGSARMVANNSEITAIVTPGYAPLEQYSSHGNQGAWSDLYALGGVLYWFVTGAKPVEAAARVRDDPLTPAAQAADRTCYSDDFLRIIDWMLLPREEERPQSVAAVKAALQSGDVTQLFTDAPIRRTASSDQPDGTPISTRTGVTLDQIALKAIEADLIACIGPIAPVAVRSAAKKAKTMAELVGALAAEITDDVERASFVKRHANVQASGADAEASKPSHISHSVPTALAEKRFDAKVLAKAEAAIAQYIGPLARTVVKRAAMKARDEAELYLLLADDVDDKDERKLFVRKALSLRE